MTRQRENEGVENGSDLPDALRDNLSPEAVVAIAAHLGSVTTNDASVNREAAWFREFLVEMIGVTEFDRIGDELGL